jgi:hypothetical protein
MSQITSPRGQRLAADVRQVLRRGAAGLRPDLSPLRGSGQFRLLFAGQAAGQFAAVMTFVAMPYQAYQLSHSSLVVGLLSVAELVPLLVSAILGGVLADAIERRVLITSAQGCLCLGSAALVVNALAWRQLWVLFLLSVLLTTASGLQRPSQEVLVPRLVARDDLSAAAALSGLSGNIASVAGPLLTGLIIAAAGLPAAYTADGAAAAAALVIFAAMRPNPPGPDAGRPSLGGTLGGLRYARSRPELMGTYLIDIGAMLFGAPYALFPQIAAGLGGPAVLGLLYAAPAVGGMIVSLTSRWTRHVHRHGRAIALSVAGWGAALTAFGFAPSMGLAVAALAAAGAADMVSGLFRMTMWNQTIPARLRGRLAGIELVSYSTGEPAGNFEAGLVASLTGSVRVAVVSGGLLSIAGAVLVAAALPALWRYDARACRPAADAAQPVSGAPGLPA